MSHPYHHAKSSARRFGGSYEAYLPVHNFFDQTKAHVADARHRMVLHNSFGIFLCEQLFGLTVTNSEGREIPTRLIAEQHVLEDFGHIPSLDRCFNSMTLELWMYTHARELSKMEDTK